MAQRANAVLEENPAALNRAFRDYGLFPWDAEAWHTPLAYAVTRGREEIVRLLIERSAVETLRSPVGETPREIAQKGRPSKDRTDSPILNTPTIKALVDGF
jgi:hypothetical protein